MRDEPRRRPYEPPRAQGTHDARDRCGDVLDVHGETERAPQLRARVLVSNRRHRRGRCRSTCRRGRRDGDEDPGGIRLFVADRHRNERGCARFWVVAALAAVVPDVDVIAFGLDIPYASIYGHRGLSHSLAFAALLAALLVVVMFRKTTGPRDRFVLWAVFFLATASHGFLDAM